MVYYCGAQKCHLRPGIKTASDQSGGTDQFNSIRATDIGNPPLAKRQKLTMAEGIVVLCDTQLVRADRLILQPAPHYLSEFTTAHGKFIC